MEEHGLVGRASEWFAGTSEPHALCRQHEWQKTALGYPETWGKSLRAAVQICLDAPSPMCVWAGPELNMLYNSAYAALLGPKRHPSSFGRPGPEVLQEFWHWLGPEVGRVMKQGQSTQVEDRRLVFERGKRRLVRYFSYSLVPVKEEGYKVVGLLNMLQETTRRVRNQRELCRMFELSGDMFAVADTRDRFYRVNPAFTEVLGWEEMEVIRMPFSSFIHPDDRERTAQDVERMAGAYATFHIENRFRHKDGSYRWLSWTAAPAPEEGLIYATARDITDQKQHQEQLLEADRRKDEFLAMLGHELRNPLAAIRGATDLIARNSGDVAQVNRANSILERQVSHMIRLVDALLEVSRIARGKIQLEQRTVDLRQIVQGVLQDRVPQPQALGLNLVCETPEEPLWVYADPVRLAQTFDNLIGNAVKFTKPPGEIRISEAWENEEIVVRVRDTGIGIAPEALDSLFTPFQQGQQRTAQDWGGLGLGLAVAKRLIELHGGSIAASSPGPMQGSEFVVRMPAGAPPKEGEEAPTSGGAAPCRILVVEDNLDAAEMLRELLVAAGNQVRTVTTGEEAIRLLRGEPADVVFCDLGLPGMSGCEFARAVRSDPELQGLKLVALTGYGQVEDRRKTAESGFDQHLVKPADTKLLNRVLKQLQVPNC